MADTRELRGSELLIERMTWPDVAAEIADGKRTVVIVAGAVEQHGPQLPEATDALMGEALACRLALRLGNALVAPVIRPGCSDHHIGFAGTISITSEVLIGTLNCYIDSLRQHGFERFVVISSHGGNYPAIAQWMADEEPADVIAVTDFFAVVRAMIGPLREFGFRDDLTPHGDLAETSLILAIHPDLVHMERAEEGYTGEVDVPTLLEKGLRSVTGNGVLGDPRGATAEIGRAVIDSMVDYLATEVELQMAADAAQHPPG